MRAMIGIMVVATTCLLTAQAAFAQDSHTFELTGGYSFLRDDGIDETLHGWMASATGHVTPLFGISAEVGSNDKALPVLATTLTYRGLSFMAGPHLSMFRLKRVTFFGQVLFGGIRTTVGILDESASRTNFAIQPGGGADFWMSRQVGIRAGADYRRIMAADGQFTPLRLHVGMVLGSGN